MFRQRLGEVLVCGLDCSRVDFLQLWEGGGEELDDHSLEGETDWTWREEEAGRQRQLEDERTRLWVTCNREEEYVLPHHVPNQNNVPTTPTRVLAFPPGQQHSLSSSPAGSLKHSPSPPSPPSSSLPIRNNLVKIEAALAKFDLLSDIVAIHR